MAVYLTLGADVTNYKIKNNPVVMMIKPQKGNMTTTSKREKKQAHKYDTSQMSSDLK